MLSTSTYTYTEEELEELEDIFEEGDLDSLVEFVDDDESILIKTDEEGNNILMLASMHETPSYSDVTSYPILEYLLEKTEEKIDLDARNDKGETAYFMSHIQTLADVWVCLGTDIYAENNEGLTRFTHLLITTMPDNEVPFHFRQADEVIHCYGDKVDPNHQNSDGKTPLIIAAEHNKLNSVRFLLNYEGSFVQSLVVCCPYITEPTAPKIEINVQDNTGQTALMYAAKNGNKDMYIFLLENGADLSLTNADGHTAAQIFANNFPHLYNEIRPRIQRIIDDISADVSAIDLDSTRERPDSPSHHTKYGRTK